MRYKSVDAPVQMSGLRLDQRSFYTQIVAVFLVHWNNRNIPKNIIPKDPTITIKLASIFE